MGPVKAALKAVVRYLAYELGPKGIRVDAASPGPIKTRSSGLANFDELLAARLIIGGTIYVDGGYNIRG